MTLLFSSWAMLWGLLGGTQTFEQALLAPTMHTQKIVAPTHGFFNIQWHRPVLRQGMHRTVIASFGKPAVCEQEGVVVVATGEGVVLALALQNGQVLWRLEHEEPFEGGVTRLNLAEPTVVVGSRHGTVLALHPQTGQQRWQTAIDGDIRAPAVQQGNVLLMTTAANQIAAINALTGSILWSKGRSPPTTLTIEGHAAAALQKNHVYVTFSDGYVTSYEIESGQELWSRPLSLSYGAFNDADADPVIAFDKLFVASYANGIHALDPKDGQTLWHRSVPAVTSLAIHDHTLIAGSADGYIWGLQEQTGQLRFRSYLGTGSISRLLIEHGLILLTSGSQGLVVLQATNGKPLQATPIATPVLSDLASSTNYLSLFTGEGDLFLWSRI